MFGLIFSAPPLPRTGSESSSRFPEGAIEVLQALACVRGITRYAAFAASHFEPRPISYSCDLSANLLFPNFPRPQVMFEPISGTSGGGEGEP